ncbi:MAG: LysM peptidoglycan-binding domain-containing protein, partial [Bacteroidota bacterium]
WLDERRDFEKATKAAAKHLKDLYERFGDWHLALAAYNSGPVRIERAIKRGHTTDFWALRKYLPRETRNYVPQYIAVALMGMRPMDFGFAEVEIADSLEYDLVKINGSVNLRVLARCAEADVEALRELNPELLQNYTPHGLKHYSLRIPRGRAELFATNYKKVPDNQKRKWAVHKVKRGETLGGIARTYRVPSSVIAQVNQVSNPRKLSIGRSLLIPIPSESNLAKQSSLTETKRAATAELRSVPGGQKVLYPIKKGDTLGKIAALFSIRASDLRNWNNIPYGSVIAEGETLSVWVRRDALPIPQQVAIAHEDSTTHKRVVNSIDSLNSASPITATYYRVRRGDNLGKIAKKYGVAVQDLQEWNKLESDDIEAGSRLVIHSVEDDFADALSSKDAQHYTVREGDTLWGISRRFGVDVSDLRRWNDLASRIIRPGDELVVQK